MAGTLSLSSKSSPFPFAAIAIACYTQKATLDFDEAAKGITLDLDGLKFSSEDEIVHALAKAGDLPGGSAMVTQDRLIIIDMLNHNLQSQTLSFFALAKTLPTVTSFPEIIAALDSLDDHLAFRTYLIGHDITVADWVLWGSLKGVYLYPHDVQFTLLKTCRQCKNRGFTQKQPTSTSSTLVHPLGKPRVYPNCVKQSHRGQSLQSTVK